MIGSPALEAFRDALAAFYLEEAASAAEAAPALRAIAARLRDRGLPVRMPPREEKPAVRLLPSAFAAAAEGPMAHLSGLLAALEPELAWQQSANYSADNVGAGFMQDYAHTLVISPRGPVVAEDVLVSVLLMGPDRFYPEHAHPAEEIYHVLAGEALWWKKGEDWQVRRPGALLRHRSWQPHATKTGKDTLLAIASWHGDATTGAALHELGSAPALPQW